MTPGHFNGILAKVRGTEHEQIVNDVVLRSQAQAEYTADNYGHFGLHLRRYAHFTSPIRRYADLIVHRALIRACRARRRARCPTSPRTSSPKCPSASRRPSAAPWRPSARRSTGSSPPISPTRSARPSQGRIAGVTRAGLFVKLADTGADGFVPAATLGDEYFRYEEAMHALVGSRSGATLRLGDAITVKLVEAAPFAGALRFEVVDGEGKAGARRSAPTSRGPRDVRSSSRRRNKG